MQGGPSIISSRMFARDERPVPNIVAIYEWPRLKVRRDATHVLGGMFGWNAPEEMARALRIEDSPVEEPTASIPNSATADPSLSGLHQQCIQRPAKRSKRRSIVPLAEMGASILSLSLQERMNRRQEGHEKEDHEPVSTLVKPSTPPMDITAIASNSTITVKKIKVATPGDVPATKKLRLTISTAPPASTTSLSTPLLQLPLSPPDTSSNGSKGPTDERYSGLVASSTPRTDQLPMPNFELDFSSIGGLSLSTLDSDSDSDSSSSESSSESSSDSSNLSSSTSTRSASQDKAKGKEKNGSEPASNKSRNTTPSDNVRSTRGPSTPPRRKRRTHPPGWVGWVQTEESPDHSRLIRLDDVPVILGRRTRSGKEFVDPPPLRRKSTAVDELKDNRPARSASNSDRMGQKSGRHSLLPEAQKRGETEELAEIKADGEHTPVTAESSRARSIRKRGLREPPAPAPSNSVSDKAVGKLSADSVDTTSAPKRIRTSLGESTNAHSPVRGAIPSVAKSANLLPTPKPSSASISVLKLTRSDAIITPTGARSKEPQRKEASPVKDSPNKVSGPDNVKSLGDLPMRPLPTLDSTRKNINPANSAKITRPSIKGTAQSQSKDTTAGAASRPALGTSKSSTLINNAKSAPTDSNPSADSNVKRFSVAGLSSRNASMSAGTEKARTAPRNPVEKLQPTKAESTWSNAIQQTPNSNGLDKVSPNANSSNFLKASSSASKLARPFPMALPSRTEKGESELKPTPFMKLSTLGKRKDPSSPLPSGQSSSSSQAQTKKRKLALSSSDESEGPRFIVNPFDRRAKKLELTRKGVSGETFQAEMKKWMQVKKAEWKEREQQKDKQNEKPNGSEVRTAIAEGKPVSEFVRHRLAGKPTSTRIGDAKLARKKVYNSDWGMDVAKVSVAGSSEKRTLSRPEVETEKRDANVKDAREPNAFRIKRDSDPARDLAKFKRVAF